MPSITKDLNSFLEGQGDFKETCNLLEKTLLDNGFKAGVNQALNCCKFEQR